MRKLRVLTWHVHGSYLYYLSKTNCIFYLPKGEGEGYAGRAGDFAWGDNVIEVPKDEVGGLAFDCILFQSSKNYLVDQYEILPEHKRRLPKIYLEHDPPHESPIDTAHVVDDPHTLLVHVTDYNNLMWNNNRTPTRVIRHGVIIPEDMRYSGENARGVATINRMGPRERRLGLDICKRLCARSPLDFIGAASKALGGHGEIPHRELPSFISRYRFFCNPIRYASPDVTLCEAMMTGLPIVGLATTEMPAIIQNGVSGYLSNNPQVLAAHIQLLLGDYNVARAIGRNARNYALEHFSIQRFIQEWEMAIQETVGYHSRSLGSKI